MPKTTMYEEGQERLVKNDASVKFAESLEIDPKLFQTFTVNKRLERITDEFKSMTFREALMAGAEGATAKLLSIVWEAAVPKLIGRQLCDVMTGTTPSIRVPIAAVAKAYQVGQAGGAPETAEKYSYAEVVARLWQSIPVVSRTLVEDAMWDVIARQYKEASRAVAEEESSEVVAVLDAAGDANQATGDSDGAFDETDLAAMIDTLESAKYNATDLVLTPHNYWSDLMTNSAIINAAAFGQGAPMVTGKASKIYGLNVWVTTFATTNAPFVMDREKAAVLYVRRDITVEDYEDPMKDLVGAVVTSRFRAKVVDGNAVVGLTSI